MDSLVLGLDQFTSKFVPYYHLNSNKVGWCLHQAALRDHVHVLIGSYLGLEISEFEDRWKNTWPKTGENKFDPNYFHGEELETTPDCWLFYVLFGSRENPKMSPPWGTIKRHPIHVDR